MKSARRVLIELICARRTRSWLVELDKCLQY